MPDQTPAKWAPARAASSSWISPSPPSDGGEGWGEEVRFYWFPLSSVLSPLVPREERMESFMQPRLAAMNSALRVRGLAVADLAFAESVRALAGWNQTLDDWRRFLAADPEGCFLAEWNGAPAGTATTTVYAPELAWIGMVLVHPDYRRRGIARALLVRSIEYLRGRGARCIKLDATPLGKQVYDELGFKDEWTLTRWECAKLQPLPSEHDPRVRGWREADARDIEPFDAQAFGVCRVGIVQALARQSRCALALEDERGS